MTTDDYVTFAWNAGLLAKAGTFEVELRDGVWTMRLRTSGATYVLSGANATTVIRGLRKLAGVPLA